VGESPGGGRGDSTLRGATRLASDIIPTVEWSEVRRSPDDPRLKLERAVFRLHVPYAPTPLVIRRRSWRVVHHDERGVTVVAGPTSNESAAWAAYRRESGDPR
jgi:hypothetical protein